MNVKKLRTRGQLAKEILLMLSAGTIIPLSLVLPNLPKALKPLLDLFSEKYNTRRESIKKSLAYLQRRGLVDTRRKKGQEIFFLTDLGKERAVRFELEKIKIKRPKFWDGYWRLIIFDIPERKRKGRDALRLKFLSMGFYLLQKSCFVYPFDCKHEINFIAEFFGLSQHIHFILAKKISGEEKIKTFFELNL